MSPPNDRASHRRKNGPPDSASHLGARAHRALHARLAFSASVALIALAIIVAPTRRAGATTRVWDGGAAAPDVLWTTGTNWNNNIAPVVGGVDLLQFATAVDTTNTNDFAAGSEFQYINFNSNAGAFVLSGNSIALNGASSTSNYSGGIAVQNQSTANNTQTLNLDILLKGNASSGSPVPYGFNALRGDIVLNGNISDDGGGARLRVIGPYTVFLNGTNTFIGQIEIASGAISAFKESNLGATPSSYKVNHLAFQGGKLLVTGTFTSGANRGFYVETRDSAEIDVSTGNTLTVNGPVLAKATLKSGATAGSTDPNDYSVQSTLGGLIKSGDGTLILGGIKTTVDPNVPALHYEGMTNVKAGTLEFAFGSSDFTLKSSLTGLPAGNLRKSGTGNLTLNKASQNVSGPSNFYIDAGTVTYAGTNRIPDATAVHLGTNATLNFNGYSDAIGGLNGGTTTSLLDVNATLDLRPQGANSYTFSGALTQKSGSTMHLATQATRLAPLTSGTQTFTIASPHNGNTLVYNGTLVLTGPSGSFLNTGTASNTSIIIGREDVWAGLGEPTQNYYATLLLNNVTDNNTDRLRNATPISMRSRGELKMTANSTSNATETVGAITVRTGRSIITLDASAATVPPSAKQLVLTGASLGLGVPYGNSEGQLAALLVRGSNLGGTLNNGVAQLKFSSAPGLTKSGSGTSIGILPYVTVQTSLVSTAATQLATYDSTFGVRPLAGTEFNSNSFIANQNTTLTGGSPTISTSTAIHALQLNVATTGNLTLTINPGATLTVQGGALLSAGNVTGGTNILTGSGALTFGDNPADASSQNSLTGYAGWFHVYRNTTLSVPITNNAGNFVDVAFSGSKTLTLTVPLQYSGATTLLGGVTFKTNSADLLPDAGTYFIDDGILELGGNETIGALSGYGTGEVRIGSGMKLTVNTSLAVGNRTYDFTGNLTGLGTLRLEGNRALRIDPTTYKLTGTAPLELAGVRRDQNTNDGTTSQFGILNFIGAYEGEMSLNLGNVQFFGDQVLVGNVNSGDTGDFLRMSIDTATIAAGGSGVLHYQGQNGYRTPLAITSIDVQAANPKLIASSAGIMTISGTVSSSGAGDNQSLLHSAGSWGRGLIQYGSIADFFSVNIARTGSMVIGDSADVVVWKSGAIPATMPVTVKDSATLLLYGADDPSNFGFYGITMPQSVTLQGNAAFATDLYNAVYSGGAQNVFLSAGTTLMDYNNIQPNYPTVAETGGSNLYRGVDVYLINALDGSSPMTDPWIDGTYGNLGDDSQNPFMGLAFGRFTSFDPVGYSGPSANYWRADLQFHTGKNAEFYLYPSREAVIADTDYVDLTAGNQIQFRSVAGLYNPLNPNTFEDADPPSLNTTTRVANFRGSGELLLYADGNANGSYNAIETNQTLNAGSRFTLNRYGDPTQNRNDIAFGRAALGGYALPQWWTANIYDGRARLWDTNSTTALHADAIVNMMSGGIWYADNIGPSSGRVNLMQGSVLMLRGTNARTDTNGDSTVDYIDAQDIVANGGSQHIYLDPGTTNGQVILDPDTNITMDLRGTNIAPIARSTDLIVSDGDSQRFLGIVLGADKRLTTSLSSNITIITTYNAPSGNTPATDEITDNAPNGKVYITAAGEVDGTKRRLRIDKDINFGSDTDVQFGDTAQFLTPVSGGDTRRILSDQNGVVELRASLTARDVTVAAGILEYGEGSGDATQFADLNSLTVKSGAFLMGRGSSTAGNHLIKVANGLTVEAGGTVNPGTAPTQYTLGELEGLGTIRVEGNVTFQQGSIFSVKLNTWTTSAANPGVGQNDVLEVTGLLDLNATGNILDIAVLNDFTPVLSVAPSLSNPYVIAKYGTLQGTFETVYYGLGLNSSYGIHYNYNNLNVIALVPEPSSFALFGLAGAALAIAIIRRRR